jgi:PAS domain S-box-containing protein
MFKQVLSTIKKIGRGEPASHEATVTSPRAALLAAMSDTDFLEFAINTINDLFTVFDIEGNLLGYNEYTKSLSGYDDEELMMKPLGVLTCTEDEAPKIREAFRLALEGDPSTVETLLVCKDGREIPVDYWLTPLRDREGSVIGVILVGRDLTERRQTEAALRESEEHFRALIENSTDLVEIIDSDNSIEYIGPSVERILGYRPDEMIGNSGFDFNHPDDLEGITEAVGKIVETGAPASAIFRVRHKDGSWRLFEGIGSTLPGTPGKLVVNIRDITDRASMEEQLRITQYEVDNALDMIIRVGPDGRISYVNDTACNLLGHSREEMLASFIWQSPLSIKEHEWPGIWGGRAQLFPNRRETEVSLRDGSNISLDLMLGIFSYKNEDNLVIFGRDITRHKTMEEELNQANRELEIFARTVTHDIMAPLSAVSIVGESVEKLLYSGFEKENVHLAREMIVTLREGIADAVGLATEVVSLSQVRPLPGTIEPVSVSKVVNRVTAQLGPDIASKGVELKVAPDLGEVLANPTHVYQLFSNLISNAVKYGTNDHPVIRISRLESSADGIHRFRVCDNGPGIKDEELEAVFQPFFRSTSGGTGLGLATVQKVVKLYGGDIAVHNDGGACFEFTLHDAYPDTG